MPSFDVFFWCKDNIYSWDSGIAFSSRWRSHSALHASKKKFGTLTHTLEETNDEIRQWKTKKNTFSLVSDLDVEESMSKVPYRQFLFCLNFMNIFWLKWNSNAVFIKIYKTSLLAHSIKRLKVIFLDIRHTVVCIFFCWWIKSVFVKHFVKNLLTIC